MKPQDMTLERLLESLGEIQADLDFCNDQAMATGKLLTFFRRKMQLLGGEFHELLTEAKRRGAVK